MVEHLSKALDKIHTTKRLKKKKKKRRHLQSLLHLPKSVKGQGEIETGQQSTGLIGGN